MKKIILACFCIASMGIASQNVNNFSLKDVNNQTKTFDELKGTKITVLDFWATWCKPCLKSIPELNKLYDIYKDKGVQIIGINTDGPRSVSKVAPLTKSLNIKYPVLIDLNSTLMNRLSIQALPTMVILDDKGKVLWLHQGFVNGDIEVITAEIEKRIK